MIKADVKLKKTAEYYFWRTYDQQEIDLIEGSGQKLTAVDFKWGNQEKRIPGYFSKNYPNAEFMVINRTNYLDFMQ